MLLANEYSLSTYPVYVCNIYDKSLLMKFQLTRIHLIGLFNHIV